MKSGSAKFFVGLIVGAAAGVAACYLMKKENREELVDQINDTIDKAKRKIGKVINQGVEELDMAVDKVNTLAQTAVNRIKAANLESGDE